MTYYPVQSPYPIFTDEDGTPLEDGYIYIGEPNQNPITNPITVTWDNAGAYPAAQPIRTQSGYPLRNGSPGKFYIDNYEYPNYSILILDKHGETIFSSQEYFEFGQATGIIDIKWYGATGDGATDDRAAIQDAVDDSGNSAVYISDGTFVIGDSGNVIAYRAADAVVGIDLPSNIDVFGNGMTSILKTAGASQAVLLTASGKSNISIKNLRIEGNAANQTDPGLLAFGMYFLNCDHIVIDNIWINETSSNTIEFVGCTDVIIGKIHSYTSSAGGSGGGGPQFEDSSNIIINEIIGDTYDDLVSLVAHAGNITDVSIGMINGTSENARALFIGQSASAGSQYTISDIKAEVNSYDCGSGGLTSAVAVSRGAIFRNLNLIVTDRSSYEGLRITPYDATYHGQLKNCIFDISSYNPDKYSVLIQHDDDATTAIENNRLNLISKNANSDDTSAIEAMRIQGGDNWEFDVNIEYPSGKANPSAAIILGTLGATNAVVTNSLLSGIVNGGDTNIKLNNTDTLNLDNLLVQNSEDGNNINIDITSTALNTRLGTIIKDGEIQDDASTTQRNMVKLFSSTTEVASSGTSETDLITYSLPADWMGKTGVIHVQAMGEITGAAGTKTLTFYFGTQSRQLQAANVTGDWVANCWVWQDGTRNAQKILLDYKQGNATVTINSTTGASDTTVANTIKITGQCGNAADSITQEAVFIEGA